MLLVQALDARERPGTALDVGCGAGTYSLYMAERGYGVTAIDFMPEAVNMLRQRAMEAGQHIDVAEADARTWTGNKQFDLVLDVGCLHSFNAEDRQAYKNRLLQWLTPGGDFILTHFGRRGWWDRWPLGPHRVSRTAIETLFGPELTLYKYLCDPLINMPLLLGRSAIVGRYWFRRSS